MMAPVLKQQERMQKALRPFIESQMEFQKSLEPVLSKHAQWQSSLARSLEFTTFGKSKSRKVGVRKVGVRSFILHFRLLGLELNHHFGLHHSYISRLGSQHRKAGQLRKGAVVMRGGGPCANAFKEAVYSGLPPDERRVQAQTKRAARFASDARATRWARRERGCGAGIGKIRQSRYAPKEAGSWQGARQRNSYLSARCDNQSQLGDLDTN